MPSILKMFVSSHQKHFPVNTLKLTLYKYKQTTRNGHIISFPLKISMENSYWYLDIWKLAFQQHHSQGITQENLHLRQSIKAASNGTSPLNACKHTRFSFSIPQIQNHQNNLGNGQYRSNLKKPPAIVVNWWLWAMSAAQKKKSQSYLMLGTFWLLQ